MTWSSEAFCEEFGVAISEFHKIFANQIVVAPNTDWHTAMLSVSNLSLVKLQVDLFDSIETIEQKLQRNAVECLETMGYDFRYLESIVVDVFRLGTLRSSLYRDINAVLGQSTYLSQSARDLLAVVDKHSGIKGMVIGVMTGYNNPIDGLLHGFGKGSLNIEIQNAQIRFQQQAQLFSSSTEKLAMDLKVMILRTWNDGVAQIQNKIEL
ncbi:hypothetical protein HYO23_22285 [Vibrio parahaemolyticus]|nr:hypothetical protein [Vibrio parahaemolyticus]